ncbi:MAG: hypothetical protein PUC40_07490 [Lachnospiraceae bacterium]|nr:hypothetical protein [Lachnospiraceae bacterium]
MPLSENAKKKKRDYIRDYNKNHYKRIPLNITHELYQKIKSASDSRGESVNGFIKKAISERLDRISDHSDTTEK